MLGALAVTLAVAAPPASADVIPGIPNFPELLPPNPFNSPSTVSVGFDVCANGSRGCPDEVIREMYRRWRPLNRRCDHNAVFALTYLRTTEEFVGTVRRSPGFFSDESWINHEDNVFAEQYFRAFDSYQRGGSVPGAWQIAFDAARSPDVTGPGDLLLGMNAHINRDLPYTLAHVGLVKPGGASRKADHDKVNGFLERVADPLQIELARRYDELFRTTDADPSPLDEVGVLQLVRGWRENAWRNAERLVNASSAGERQSVADSIESQSASFANSIRAANTIPGYGPVRDAYCRAHNTDDDFFADLFGRSLRVKVASRAIARVVNRRRLKVRVTARIPRTATLTASLRTKGARTASASSRTILAQRRMKFDIGRHRVGLRLKPAARRALRGRKRATVLLVASNRGKEEARSRRKLRRR